MMDENLTADTITVTQLEELAKSDEPLAIRAAYVALGRIVPRKGDTKAKARARCAEIFNARSVK